MGGRIQSLKLLIREQTDDWLFGASTSDFFKVGMDAHQHQRRAL